MEMGSVELSIKGNTFSRAVPANTVGQLKPAKVPTNRPMMMVEIPPWNNTRARSRIIPVGLSFFKKARHPKLSTMP